MTEVSGRIQQLCHAVAERLQRQQRVLVSAESCTGGGLGAAVTAVPGSSGWYAGGVIVYSNALKTRLLGVSPSLLAEQGAVSEAVAAAMARGAREALDGDVAVAITGIAGPGGGSAAKPVGTVCFAWAMADDVIVHTCHFSGDREAVRQQAIVHALEGILLNGGPVAA